ncbi:MAG: hypothetical protein B6I17_02065 [Tenericutes bacterium 4572_104]|nr:MAG: hypothetical protein B6I17_02065 [Tenericutes bacterium 4572_104]
MNQLFNKKYIKRKIIIIAVITILFFIIGASGGDKEQIDRTGQAKTPSGSSVYEGDNYSEVIDKFEERGFTNIKSVTIEDLIIGLFTKDGEVESVSVDGDINYSSSTWYLNDVEVIITYHTFPNDETEEKSETEEDGNNEGIKESIELEITTNEDAEASSREVSGFDTAINQSTTWCGIDFYFPTYYDVLDENSHLT